MCIYIDTIYTIIDVSSVEIILISYKKEDGSTYLASSPTEESAIIVFLK